MTKQTLDYRQQALEESFFRGDNDRLLEELRKKSERDVDRAELANEIGYHDTAVLDQFLDAGIEAETWLAVRLVPLVEVAWADGHIAYSERAMILEAASKQGIDAGTAAHTVLEHWLKTRPPKALRDAWKAYVLAIQDSLDSGAVETFKLESLGRSRQVAKATHSLMGRIRGITSAETIVLDDLGHVFG